MIWEKNVQGSQLNCRRLFMRLQAKILKKEEIEILFSFLSQDRIESYRKTPLDSHEILLTRYLWNIALCEACYPALSLLEVALRNQIDKIFVKALGNTWLQENSKFLKLTERAEIEKVKTRINYSKKSKNLNNNNSELISTLTLGFWASLFRNEYAPLWHKHLKFLFPHLIARHRTPKFIFKQLRQIRDFRNRVFHHEPIWHWKNLLNRYQEILTVLDWLSPILKKSLIELERFQIVYEKGINLLSYEVEDYKI